MSEEPMFPILGCAALTRIPWRLVEPGRAQAQKNHSQTLERLAERGGLGPGEVRCAIEGKPLWPHFDNRGDVANARRAAEDTSWLVSLVVADLRARLAACEKERDEARKRFDDLKDSLDWAGRPKGGRPPAILDGRDPWSMLERERDAGIALAEKAERERSAAYAKATVEAAALGAAGASAREEERDAARAEAAAMRATLQTVLAFIQTHGRVENHGHRLRDGVDRRGACGLDCAVLDAIEAALDGDAGRALLDEVRGLREADAECIRQHETSKREGADAARASIAAELRTKFAQNRHAQQIADYIERREDLKREDEGR